MPGLVLYLLGNNATALRSNAAVLLVRVVIVVHLVSIPVLALVDLILENKRCELGARGTTPRSGTGLEGKCSPARVAVVAGESPIFRSRVERP